MTIGPITIIDPAPPPPEPVGPPSPPPLLSLPRCCDATAPCAAASLVACCEAPKRPCFLIPSKRTGRDCPFPELLIPLPKPLMMIGPTTTTELGPPPPEPVGPPSPPPEPVGPPSPPPEPVGPPSPPPFFGAFSTARAAAADAMSMLVSCFAALTEYLCCAPRVIVTVLFSSWMIIMCSFLLSDLM